MNNLSLDVGGTKIHIAIFDDSHRSILNKFVESKYIFTGHGEKDLYRLFKEVKAQTNNERFNKFGISFKGILQNNKITYSSLLKNEQPIDISSIAKQYLHFSSLVAENDVFSMAKAELIYGIGRMYKNFLYINLGTGIRPVFVDNAKLLRGYKNLAGEISLMKIWVRETNSYWKTDELLGGIGLAKLSKVLCNESYHGENFFRHGNLKLVDIYTSYLAQFLQTVSFFYNPEIIIFGGSLIKSADVWLQKTKNKYFSFPSKFLLSKDIVISTVEQPASLGALL